MNLKLSNILFILFVLFVASRFFINNLIPPLFYTVITFFVPIVYFLYKKDYYIFYFNTSDTLPSIGINISFAVGFVMAAILIGFYFKDYSWVFLLYSNPLLALPVSLMQEMLFRYFIQNNILKLTESKIKAIVFTSIISAVVLLPSFLDSIAFFIIGIAVGYIFDKTQDIYGATLANLIISLFMRAIG